VAPQQSLPPARRNHDSSLPAGEDERQQIVVVSPFKVERSFCLGSVK
jgi:hypothetical protein